MSRSMKRLAVVGVLVVLVGVVPRPAYAVTDSTSYDTVYQHIYVQGTYTIIHDWNFNPAGCLVPPYTFHYYYTLELRAEITYNGGAQFRINSVTAYFTTRTVDKPIYPYWFLVSGSTGGSYYRTQSGSIGSNSYKYFNYTTNYQVGTNGSATIEEDYWLGPVYPDNCGHDAQWALYT
jgi:hypothetical protein